MSFYLILYVFAIFLLTVTAQILIWRIFKPQQQILWLFSLCLGFPFLIFFIIFIIYLNLDSNSLTDLCYAGLLFFSLSCAYIQTYPAAQTFSPSLQIVYFLHKSGKEGLTEQEILNQFDPGALISDRIDDLIIEKFVIKHDENLILGIRGKILGNIYYFYRKLCGLNIGEG